MVDERQRGKGQRGASVALGLGKTTDDLLLAAGRRDLLDAHKDEWRACAVGFFLYDQQRKGNID